MKKIVIEKDLIIKAIQENKNKTVLSKELNISVPTLNRICKSYNINYPIINFRKNKEFLNERIRPDIDKQWFINNWLNTNKSLYQLAKENNINYSILDNRARKYNLFKKYKYKLNIEKLFNLQDPKVYYLAGLIATDGYLEINHDALSIDLTGEDELILLNEIKNYFQLTNNVVHYNKSNRLRIACDGLKKFLLDNFNISQCNKTFTVKTPIKFYNNDCVKAYLRGCLDGDGCISNKTFSLFTASEEFIKGLIDLINSNLNINLRMYYIQGKVNKIPGIQVSGKKTKIILSWIYELDNCFRLNRKYQKYLKLMI